MEAGTDDDNSTNQQSTDTDTEDTGTNRRSFEDIAEVLLDDLKYIETLLVVKTKDAKTVPFRFTPIQRRVALEQARRNIYLKPRQVGMSTFHLARRFARVCTIPNWTAVSVAHDSTTTELLFQTVQFFYNNLPPEFRPKTKYNNRRELYFPEINSRYVIFTAGNENGIGRGVTVNDIHGSEVALWPNPDELISGLLETAPKNAYVDLESTAKGAGGYFHTEYVDALEGKNNYKPFFFPWWWQIEYRLTDAEALAYNIDPYASFNKEETALVEKHRLDRQQINWRRWKIAALKKLFHQEYPEDETSCFLTSGNLYFEEETISRARAEGAQEPLQTRKNGGVLIWQAPQPDHTYIIGADVAEGLPGGDYDAASVIDTATGQEVAALHGLWKPHDYAELLSDIGHEYNEAVIAVERNNHGHAVLTTLIYQEHYPEIYEHQDYDVRNDRATKLPGYPTNRKTKPILLTTLEQMMEDWPGVFHDTGFFRECYTFVRHPDGKVGAIYKCHDDRIMARAIAYEVRKSHKPKPGYRVLNLLSDDDDDDDPSENDE